MMRKYRLFCEIGVLIAVLSYQSAISLAGDYTYAASDETFPNPERGWYSYAPILSNASYSDLGNSGTI